MADFGYFTQKLNIVIKNKNKMKLKIKNFKELVDKEISLPQAIVSGANGAGKTTILEAFYFVIDGKKADGSVVGGEIYSQYAKTKNELIVEVELEIDENTKFCRRCEGSEKRAKGTAEVQLIRNINTTLFVEKDGKRDVVTQKEWNDEMSVYFPENYRYFTNPNYLEQQKQSDVKDFVFELLNLSEFNTKNKNIAKLKVSEIKKEIGKLDNKISVHNSVIGPDTVVDLANNFDAKIKDLRLKINIPQLTDAENLHNSEIHKQIASVELEKPKIAELKNLLDFPILSEKSLMTLKSVDLLENEIKKIGNTIFDKLDFKRESINKAKMLNTRKKDLENKIENYDKIKEDLNCTICPVCTDLFCEKRSVDIDSFENLQEQNASIDYIDVGNLEKQIELQRVEFVENKNNQIAGLKLELEKIKSHNAKIKRQNDVIVAENEEAVRLYNLEVGKIKKQNAKIKSENEIILQENAKIKSNFEREKAEQIKELRECIKYPVQVDNSEIENKIANIEIEKSKNKAEFIDYAEKQAIYQHAQKEKKRLLEEKTALFEKLVDDEQVLILEKEEERKYYSEIEKKINAELSGLGIRFKLYRKLISTDDYKADFEIILNNRKFNSNGEAFIQKINLCLFFQSRKNIVLPILCDETTVLDDFNIQNLITIFDKNKNIVLLEKTAESLRIINF